MAEKYTNLAVSKKETGVEITGSIPTEEIAKYRAKALKEFSDSLVIPGFRKGHIPEKNIIDKVGEMNVIEEAAEQALKDIAPEIIEKNAPNFVGRPNVSVTKLAPGNPVEFKIVVEVLPEFDLPDYKKIASKEMSAKDEPIEIADKEIDAVVEEVRKQRAHVAYHQANKDAKDHSHKDEEVEKLKPEFNDEFVKTVGEFKDVADFRAKVKENLTKEKEQRGKEKKRGMLLEKLVSETKVAVPQSLVDHELSRMFSQFESDIAGMGLKVEDYLKHIKKTPEDLRKDWAADALKRAKLNLILDKIAEKEKIKAEKEEIDNEMKHLLEHYKDADPVQVALYVNRVLTVEKTIKFLEEQK